MWLVVFFDLFITSFSDAHRTEFAGYQYPHARPGDVFYQDRAQDNFRDYEQIILFTPEHNPSKYMSKSRQYVGQLIPPGQPWPHDEEGYATFSPVKRPSKRPPVLEDRLQVTSSTTTKSPLEYNPNQRPTFIGATGGSQLGQLIPGGQPWPANQEDYSSFSPTSQRPNLEDRFKETTTRRTTPKIPFADEGVPTTTRRTTKTPLEYVPNRPTFIGATGGSHLSQLIPSGQPWPSNQEDYGSFSPTSKPNLEDRFKETTTQRVVTRPTRRKRPQKTSRPPTQKTTTKPPPKPTSKKPSLSDEQPVKPVPTKSPLEYVPHKPSYAGSPSLGQIIPPGTPFPAGDVTERTTVRTKERTTVRTKERTTVRTKGPTQSAVLNLNTNTAAETSTPAFELFIVNKENIPPAREQTGDDCEDDEELVEENEINDKKGETFVQQNINLEGPNTLEEGDEEDCEDDEEEINESGTATMLFTSPLFVTENILQDKQGGRRTAVSSTGRKVIPPNTTKKTPELTNLLLDETEKLLKQIDSLGA